MDLFKNYCHFNWEAMETSALSTVLDLTASAAN